MPRHHMINNVKVPFTAQEEIDKDAEELAWTNARPMEDWKEVMSASDFGMPRFLEDLITSNSLVIPTEMKKHYDEKVALRATQPKE